MLSAAAQCHCLLLIAAAQMQSFAAARIQSLLPAGMGQPQSLLLIAAAQVYWLLQIQAAHFLLLLAAGQRVQQHC